ncbi:uncharacterized protein B0H64DRAFT_448287 [Chaetomium fimeti]|uniref:Uncharacterized protein n=1 Tax=Chaetomium fimeti TaxID=1854472 RepID=A0AAE0LWF9_9PEZI|nr:hypothetical protein B0H64DRAFT_448287 [Chaetomium fimeti]
MGNRDSDSMAVDKEWASKYILGPLYDPEPNQVSATRLEPRTTPSSSTRNIRDYLGQRSRKPVVKNPDEAVPFLRNNSIKRKPLPPSPPQSKYPPRSKYPPLSGLERKRSLHTANPPQTRWNQGTILTRADSLTTPRPSADIMAAVGDHNGQRRRASSLADSSHRPVEAREGGGGKDTIPRRSGSLRERYPGDMSHRPLAMLTKQHRAADRAPHLRTHRRQQPSDTIDTLDITGPVPSVYHHSGPFDATLKERNTNKKYAPVEAVKETNAKALKATPPEYIQDSLVKHMPLQGTAVVPPGTQDMAGRTMHYEEGADLMREEDAAGGAYKRWEHINYRDDDFKGKGEPSFSYDQSRRDKQRAAAPPSHPDGAGAVSYEMQPTVSSSSSRSYDRHRGHYGHHSNHGKAEEGVTLRQRSVSHGDARGRGDDGEAGSSGLQRRNSAGKGLAQSLKRRFGSLRRGRAGEEGGY